jgi:hypothetical protein
MVALWKMLLRVHTALWGGFAWSHVAAIAIPLVGMRLIVVHLGRQPRTH